jgi:ribonuclease P protein component
VKRNFRLTRSTDFKRVQNSGKSYAHPLVVLIAIPSATLKAGPATENRLREALPSRVGVAAGRSVGGAVQRNRAKRLLREAMRMLLPTVRPGWDLILIARQPLPGATYQQVQAALSQLMRRADLLTPQQP